MQTRKMKKQQITSSVAGLLVAAFSVITISAQTSEPQQPRKRPALVVGIVVEGLTMDYLDLLRTHFGEGGFKRLLEQGITVTDLDFGTPLDGAAASAMLFTGASPAVNGIPAATVYNTETRRAASVLLDPETIGNFTDETLSPKSLTASTIADELRIDGGGLGYVYAIAPDAAEAIILGGHTGNSAFWINDATGKWEKVPYYTVNDRMPLGHGSKSAMIIKQYMDLTNPEMYAIWHHMGFTGDYENNTTVGAAFEKYPLALALYMADMMASRIMEAESGNKPLFAPADPKPESAGEYADNPATVEPEFQEAPPLAQEGA